MICLLIFSIFYYFYDTDRVSKLNEQIEIQRQQMKFNISDTSKSEVYWPQYRYFMCPSTIPPNAGEGENFGIQSEQNGYS